MAIKNYKLFVDDCRNPPDDSWVVARSSKEAIDIVLNSGIPTVISLDHNLGDCDSGYEFVKWFVELATHNRDRRWLDVTYTIHSMNPVGKENIKSLIGSMYKFFGSSCDL